MDETETDTNPTGSIRRARKRPDDKTTPSGASASAAAASASRPIPRRKTPAPRTNRAARSAAGAAVKSIYFSDPESLDALEAAVQLYPRSSVSHIVSQFTKLFVTALADVEEGERKIPINGHVYL